MSTANCATSPQQKLAAGNGIDPKYGVRASPRLYNEGDVIGVDGKPMANTKFGTPDSIIDL